jgi:hypothetical protein
MADILSAEYRIMSVPIPQRKPTVPNDVNSASGGDNSLLGSIWDFGKNTFKAVLDFEFEQNQLERQNQLEIARAKAEANLSRQYITPTGQTGKVTLAGYDPMTIGIIGGGLLVAAYYLMK